MPCEEWFSSVCGPPIVANTAVSKDVGVYHHVLTPSYSVKATFKKSQAPRHGLAISDGHIFAVQDGKSQVHVYSRLRGNQEALISFTERIRSLSLSGNMLILGTTEGRLILWETCTGRQVTTPPCHLQAISCIAVTPYYVLSASEDSNINVWSLARLSESNSQAELEPELILSNHRDAITDLVVSSGSNPETSFCVSASKDKTVIFWNYHTGQVLRTLLFPATPLCISLDPSGRALVAASEGCALFLVDLFGEEPLLGSNSPEPTFVVQISAPLGSADPDAGDASCLALTYDGSCVLTGHTKGKIMRWSLAENSHPVELANLNASVTNVVFTPLVPSGPQVQPHTVVKPNHTQRNYTFTAQLRSNTLGGTRFDRMFNAQGFPTDTLEEAIVSFTATSLADGEEDQSLQAFSNFVDNQKKLTKAFLEQQVEAV